MKTICGIVIAFMTGSVCLANDLESVITNLEKQVGGKWQLETNSTWMFVSPKELPPALDKGTYDVFVDSHGKTSLELAAAFASVCQAPFFILGTNAHCTVITYVSRRHPVSRAIIKTLGLKEPDSTSPAEQLIFRNEATEEETPNKAFEAIGDPGSPQPQR